MLTFEQFTMLAFEQFKRLGDRPRYWMHESSGVLRPVVLAYLEGRPLSEADIAMLRAYFRQWIMSSVWMGVEGLRERVEGLRSREAIEAWLRDAVALNVDPL